jgi:hypothetical protein
MMMGMAMAFNQTNPPFQSSTAFDDQTAIFYDFPQSPGFNPPPFVGQTPTKKSAKPLHHYFKK